jgi:hypothetical protein
MKKTWPQTVERNECAYLRWPREPTVRLGRRQACLTDRFEAHVSSFDVWRKAWERPCGLVGAAGIVAQHVSVYLDTVCSICQVLLTTSHFRHVVYIYWPSDTSEETLSFCTQYHRRPSKTKDKQVKLSRKSHSCEQARHIRPLVPITV